MFDINDSILDLKKVKIEPVNDDELFVKVNNTHNYWVSNYGRLVNNLRGKYFVHKTGDVHWTLSAYYIGENKQPRDTHPCELVAEHFLEKIKYKNRIWFIDGDRSNNYYKNLIYVDDKEYYKLSIRKITIQDLGRNQEYLSFVTAARNRAIKVYNGIYKRCFDSETKKMYPHYGDSTMYEGWKNDHDVFVEWYESNYYECGNEMMVVDKDLLFKGNKEYHPNKCCILPVTLNNMLSNCKKHYYRDDGSVLSKKGSGLPLGVRYDKGREKYFSQMSAEGVTITFGYWDTKEEAFEEYKKHKEAYILVMADRYKNKIPKHIYDALLRVRVEPY